MMFMTSDSPGRSRRLSTIASGALSSRLASARADHAADVGRDDHQVAVTVTRLDVGRHRRRGVEVVGRDVEEALDLPGVEIDRQHPVGPRLGDQVGD
jgi:hypothetical protein